MKLAMLSSLFSPFRHKNGIEEEIVVDATALQEPAEQAERPAQTEVSRYMYRIPYAEVVEELREFVNEEMGVVNSRIFSRYDREGLLRLRIEVLPTDAYKKSNRLRALLRRISSDVSRQTGIPRAQIVVKRDLKIMPSVESAEALTL